jgi:hypothetical protein
MKISEKEFQEIKREEYLGRFISSLAILSLFCASIAILWFLLKIMEGLIFA